MQTVQQQLQNAVDAALEKTLDASTRESLSVSRDALSVVPCANPQFGNYQWNGALPLAKSLKRNPRELATQMLENLDVSQICEPPQIAGAGFLNFTLTRAFVEAKTAQVFADERLGVPLASTRKTFVVDFSSPNVAKPMHVGHIRSTIIGAAIAQLLRFAGHKVITDNHIGDWGTQFGKIIVGWKSILDEGNLARDPISEMERLYKTVNAQSESDPKVAGEARRETAALQNGDEENLAIWRRIRELSQQQFDEIYARLGVTFDETLGESFYNDALSPLVQELKNLGVAKDSEGAVIVTFEDDPQLAERPLLIQKSDGAALYGTTDLATIQYRATTWQPDSILYVVGTPQKLHFQQVFAAAKKMGHLSNAAKKMGKYEDIDFRHVNFGSVLGEDGSPIKTRSGESVKLRDLLDEAESRALAAVETKNPELTDEQKKEVARVVGIGAVKYTDLAQNRASDYVFSWDKMLAMQGNTAPYLQYAYVRIRSIFRRAEIDARVLANPTFVLQENAELELAKFILRFPLAIESSIADYRSNVVTDYAFDLAQKFTAFYDACPVLKSDEPLRTSRLALCDLTARVLQKCLNLLGIETLEQM